MFLLSLVMCMSVCHTFLYFLSYKVKRGIKRIKIEHCTHSFGFKYVCMVTPLSVLKKRSAKNCTFAGKGMELQA